MSKLIVTFNRSFLKALLRRDQCYLWDDRYIGDGSFSMIGGRGQNNWILLGPNERKFIYSIPPNDQLVNWSASPSGDIYTDWSSGQDYMRWPVILISSTFTDIQHVRVLKIEKCHIGTEYLDCALIDSIPYQANGDYSAYTPDKHPEYWLKAYADYPYDEDNWLTNPNAQPPTYGPSHNGLTFMMPLWNPISGFPRSTDADEIGGFWVDARVLA